MFARNIVRTQILKKSCNFLQFKKTFCSKSREPQNDSNKSKIDVAGKVIAKDPPVKELTHGGKYCNPTGDKKETDDVENKIEKPAPCPRRESSPPAKKSSEKKMTKSGRDQSSNNFEIERKKVEASIQLMRQQVAQLIFDTPDDGTDKRTPVDGTAKKTPVDGTDKKTPIKAAVPVVNPGRQLDNDVGDNSDDHGAGGNVGDIGTIPPDAPRTLRSEPGKTFFCLIPAEWVKAFNEKTGVTGFWTFAVTYGTYLVSKEKLVMEHEYYGGLSHIVLWWLAVKYVGPGLAASIDKKIDLYEQSFQQGRDDQKEDLDMQVAFEENLQDSMEGQATVVEAKRENVDLQLEAEYRERLHTAYESVVNILNFHVKTDEVNRRFAHKNMAEWVINEVHKSLTEEFHNNYMNRCFDELGNLLQAKAT